MSLNAASFNRRLSIMRTVCPVVAVICFGMVVLCLDHNIYAIACINGALFGFNIGMSYIQWFIFKPFR